MLVFFRFLACSAPIWMGVVVVPPVVSFDVPFGFFVRQRFDVRRVASIRRGADDVRRSGGRKIGRRRRGEMIVNRRFGSRRIRAMARFCETIMSSVWSQYAARFSLALRARAPKFSYQCIRRFSCRMVGLLPTQSIPSLCTWIGAFAETPRVRPVPCFRRTRA